MKKVLIANRGEIAVRVIRACQELDIATVAVYSVADKDSFHTKIADESVCIGPGSSLLSYLSIPAIMSAAEVTGADAVHPGYGFLSENAKFAECCEKYGIEFIGPRAEHIRLLGDKVSAREAAVRANVPLLPGSPGKISDLAEAKSIAKEVGYPIIIKAAAGGGGRGMKIVYKESELEKQFQVAQQEALNFFGNPDVFMERYCQSPRHVEVQLLCDNFGNRLYLGERDCSVQRRHQKLIEEAPCPVLTDKQRAYIGEVSVNLAKEVGYVSAGTVEFLLDSNGEFYFMEVNTRIQVEHPVTEYITSIDLIKEQIKIASGEKLTIKQKDIVLRGHSIECRINAEDPVTFAPCPGKITDYHQPGGPGVRVDGMIYSGYSVPPNYDSMLAKLIVHGCDREEALSRMKRALSEMVIDGIKTNIDFQMKVITHPRFIESKISTHFLNEEGWVK